LKDLDIKSSKTAFPLIYKCEATNISRKKALISCLWSDDFVISPRAYYSDGFVHRQYCIGIRGIESFVHLFGKTHNDKDSSLFEAKNLLNRNSHFFDRLKGEMSMFRDISILKSILFDASTNYLEYNSTLAHWRGLRQKSGQVEGPIGHPILMDILNKYSRDGIKNWRRVLRDSTLTNLVEASALNQSNKRGAEIVEEGEEYDVFSNATFD
jgi:hypothetical protein